MDRDEREAREEMSELSKEAGIHGWTQKMSDRYKELMEQIDEDPGDFHCDHY